MTRLTISGDYAADWPAISRATKDEAGWRCVRCIHPFGRETGRPLACDDRCDTARCKSKRIVARGGSHNYGVHHLDGDKGNNRWWNRLALCNSCHLYVQATVIPERLYLFHHSEWFRVYAGGYYAFAIAGLDLDRLSIELDTEWWLDLGQPWLRDAAVAQ